MGSNAIVVALAVSAKVRCAIEVAVLVDDHVGYRESTVEVGDTIEVKVVDVREEPGSIRLRLQLVDDAAVVIPPAYSCAIQIAVSVEDESAVGTVAVGTGKV